MSDNPTPKDARKILAENGADGIEHSAKGARVIPFAGDEPQPPQPPDTSGIKRGAACYPSTVPPDSVILGDGWLRKGDLATLVSTAGAGKSVAATQAALCWSAGLPYLGITPPRPLRILMFCAEDDESTIGGIREGLFDHATEATGHAIGATERALIEKNLRTDFNRSHVGIRFAAHLESLLADEPADCVIVNPLLSYVGGEAVSTVGTFLREGILPILQRHECAAIFAHHTPKMARDGWDTTDDVYSAIGGSEIANIPRCILTLRPTPADGLFALVASKRKTTGWRDDMDEFTDRLLLTRTPDPSRPAWIPADPTEARRMLADAKGSSGSSKVSLAHVLGELKTGAMHRLALIQNVQRAAGCSDKLARDAIRAAEDAAMILSYTEPRPGGGRPLRWFHLPSHQPTPANDKG